MGKAEIEAFLMALVSKRNVSSSTHRLALSALLLSEKYGRTPIGIAASTFPAQLTVERQSEHVYSHFQPKSRTSA